MRVLEFQQNLHVGRSGIPFIMHGRINNGRNPRYGVHLFDFTAQARRIGQRCVGEALYLHMRAEPDNLCLDLTAKAAHDGKGQQQRRHAHCHPTDSHVSNKTKETTTFFSTGRMDGDNITLLAMQRSTSPLGPERMRHMMALPCMSRLSRSQISAAAKMSGSITTARPS